MDVIRELCSFENRLAGTDAERRAANWLATRLRDGGRRAEIEPTYVHPQYGLVHAAHCALGVAGSLLAIAQPAIGFAIVLATAASMYLDLNYRIYLLRRLFFRRASQNVVAPGKRSDAPARILLCAHYDAARTGAAFNPKRVARGARLAARLRVPIGPFRILFWSLAILLPILGARMAGIDSSTDLGSSSSPPPWSSCSASSCSSTSSSRGSSRAPTTTPPGSRPCSRSPRSSTRTRPPTSTSGCC